VAPAVMAALVAPLAAVKIDEAVGTAVVSIDGIG
jgi:hypothetical protein